MASPKIWFPFYPAAFLQDTVDLAPEEGWAYLLLLLRYYTDGPLPDDDRRLARIARVSLAQWTTEVGPRVRSFFHTGDDGLLHQTRADAELARRETISAERSDAGRRGVEVREARRRAREQAEIEAFAAELRARTEPAPVEANASVLHDDLLKQTHMQTPTHVHVHTQLQLESVPPSEDAAAAAPDAGIGVGAGTHQETPLPDDPAPSPTPGQLLWSEGLTILSVLLDKSAAQCRPALAGFVRRAAPAGPESLLTILRDCAAEPPKVPFAWIRRCCEQASKRAQVKVVVDNGAAPPVPADDPWGIEAWCASMPDARPTESEGDRKMGRWLLGGWVLDRVARRVAEEAHLPLTWRGDWTLLGEWLAEGRDVDAIYATVSHIAGGVIAKGQSVRSLHLFDGAIREGRRQVA